MMLKNTPRWFGRKHTHTRAISYSKSVNTCTRPRITGWQDVWTVRTSLPLRVKNNQISLRLSHSYSTEANTTPQNTSTSKKVKGQASSSSQPDAFTQFEQFTETIRQLERGEIEPSVSTLNDLLHVAVSNNSKIWVKRTLELYKRYSVNYNAVTYNCLIKWAGYNKDMTRLQRIWKTVCNKHLITSDIVSHMLSQVYHVQPDAVFAEDILITAKKAGIELNCSTYEYVFSIFRKQNQPELFLLQFYEFKKKIEKGILKNDYAPVWIRIVDGMIVFFIRIDRDRKHLTYAVNNFIAIGDKRLYVWEQLLCSLILYSSDEFFRAIFQRMFEIDVIPSPSCFQHVARSLFLRTYNLLRLSYDAELFEKGLLPADTELSKSISDLLQFRQQGGVVLDSTTMNFILLALARGRLLDQFTSLSAELINGSSIVKDFQLDIYGYIAHITSIIHRHSLLDSASPLNEVDSLKQKALSSNVPERLYNHAITILYETLMCAYAILEEPQSTTRLHTLVEEMKTKNIIPKGIFCAVRCFNVTQQAMDKLLNIVRKHWPKLAEGKAVSTTYFLTLMLDGVRTNKFKLTANDDDLKLMTSHAQEAFQKCSNLAPKQVLASELWTMYLSVAGKAMSLVAMMKQLESDYQKGSSGK